MRLKDYRTMIGLSVREAASAIGVSGTIWRQWEKLEKDPSRVHKVRLYKWSKGHVTPNDFYELPEVLQPAPVPSAAECKGRRGGHGFCATGGFAMPAQIDLFVPAEASS